MGVGEEAGKWRVIKILMQMQNLTGLTLSIKIIYKGI